MTFPIENRREFIKRFLKQDPNRLEALVALARLDSKETQICASQEYEEICNIQVYIYYLCSSKKKSEVVYTLWISYAEKLPLHKKL